MDIYTLSARQSRQVQNYEQRLLFVCSASMARSASAAQYFASLGYNTRACGTEKYALVPLSINLLNWADDIYFFSPYNVEQAKKTFYGDKLAQRYIENAHVLHIPDVFPYKDEKLMKLIKERVVV